MADETVFWNALGAAVASLDRLPPERINSSTFLRVMTAVGDLHRADEQRRSRVVMPPASSGYSGRQWGRLREFVEAHRRDDLIQGYYLPDELDKMLMIAQEEYPAGLDHKRPSS